MKRLFFFLAYSTFLWSQVATSYRLESDYTTERDGNRRPQWTTAIRVAPETAKSGEKLVLRVERKNISGRDLKYDLSTNLRITARWYHVEVRDAEGVLAPETALGREVRTGKPDPNEPLTVDVGSWFTPNVRPMASYVLGIPLNLSYNLTQPGKYTAQIVNLDDDGNVLLKSNTVSFTIAN
jgi:hypothetical protein